jgi:hypothetical protein
MLTYALRTHVKLPKSKKLTFNVIKYLMFKVLNAQIPIKYYYIFSLTLTFSIVIKKKHSP